MKLTFLGTRGYIDASTRRHRRHTAMLVEYKEMRVMIDCGKDWERKLKDINPQAIFITHAHPDHAWGLKEGTDIPVYASRDAWKEMKDYPLSGNGVLKPRTPKTLRGIILEAFPVIHSLRAPAVGYRISAGHAALFYVPDVIDIEDRAAALRGIDVFVGDGASLKRPLVRRKGDKLFGHTTVRAQLG